MKQSVVCASNWYLYFIVHFITHVIHMKSSEQKQIDIHLKLILIVLFIDKVIRFEIGLF